MMSIAKLSTIKSLGEKLLTHGAQSLTTAELVAIFVQSDTREKSPIELACTLLAHFGGIRNLLDAHEKQFHGLPDISKKTYTLLQAALEIARRYLAEQLSHTDIISNTKAAASYLTAKLRHYQRETFACLFLNNHNQMLHYEELFYGTINNITIYPREVAKIALYHNAAAVILAHNHPAGPPLPSPQDHHLTTMLTKILQPLAIQVLDHIIIGANGYSSVFEQDSIIRA